MLSSGPETVKPVGTEKALQMIKKLSVSPELEAELKECQLMKLIDVYKSHRAANVLKSKYYEGHVTLGDVNLGIALPRGFRGLEIGCAWGAKCVDVLAARSMFDGFVAEDGTDASAMREILTDNNLVYEYGKACRDELKYGCTFATLSHGGISGVRIRWHTPQTAAAIWDGENDRIECGFAVISVETDPRSKISVIKIINLYTSDATWVLRHVRDAEYIAERVPHIYGVPLMVPFIWNATSEKPFGRSRLTSSNAPTTASVPSIGRPGRAVPCLRCSGLSRPPRSFTTGNTPAR